MAFLDNSGDIILDAVLTDIGRKRMAQGDGSFRITKFALGDDEINYNLWNSAHTGGTAYFGMEILQTPIEHAFSNSEASLNSKLVSYTNPNLLYLPMMILNTNANKTYGEKVGFFPYDPVKNAFVVTTTEGGVTAFGNTRGVLNGMNPGAKDSHIRLEFGLNVEGQTPGSLKAKKPELDETQFLIECDTRFCTPAKTSGEPLNASFIDENGTGTYIVTTGGGINSGVVSNETQFGSYKDLNQPEMKWLRGARLEIKILASSFLQFGLPAESKSLWAKHGLAYGTGTWTTAASSITTTPTCTANNLNTRANEGTLFHIDTNIRVTGFNSGIRVDIPIVLVKDVNFVTTC